MPYWILSMSRLGRDAVEADRQEQHQVPDTAVEVEAGKHRGAGRGTWR